MIDVKSQSASDHSEPAHKVDQANSAAGQFVEIHGEDFYCIRNYDRMPPFLMNIVSAGDLWMYVSSSGGLTAGRVHAANSLFPYQTVDRLHHCHHDTGPVTLLRWSREPHGPAFWQPFADRFPRDPHVTRNLYKHVTGNHLIFEEKHALAELTFRYHWQTSTSFGFVRTAEIQNEGAVPVTVEVVDGFQNVLPYGVELGTIQQASCLADAYKYSEVDPQTSLGIFSLTAKITDRAEAAEVLRANTVWCYGLDDFDVLLDADVLSSFAAGGNLRSRSPLTGQRGNYLVTAGLQIEAGQQQAWRIVADVGQDYAAVTRLQQVLSSATEPAVHVDHSLREDHCELLRNLASADGLQLSGSATASAHHRANVLFNNMRGGVFVAGYDVATTDFAAFVAARNRQVAGTQRHWLSQLPATMTTDELAAQADGRNDRDLLRIVYEYLPLTFGRRHGDPSRPWNQFEIRVRDEQGQRIYHYQGNWRDIFQNWDALCQSFPGFLPHVVAKFVNASTIDGYNPYRVMRDGIDWEVPNPDDPWSNIGYWGDHQVAYLGRLLESLFDHDPGALKQMLCEERFCYTDVPYRIRPYSEVVRDPRDTIEYDRYRAEDIVHRVQELGNDGTLVVDRTADGPGAIHYVNLAEKLVVPALAKLSNFVVDGGIWLNTQRPEWNDANNALVGNGLSMVTVCYLRRYLQFLLKVLRQSDAVRIAFTTEVEQWFRRVHEILIANRHDLHAGGIDDHRRREILDQLGTAFSDYRLKVYDDGFSGKHTVGINTLLEFAQVADEYLEHAIRVNRRPDRLFHSYNLLQLHDASAGVQPLHEMLEGQVAVLSSGLLDAAQAAELATELFESDLFRADQRTFLLYPQRQLPGFLGRNQIDAQRARQVELLATLLDAGDRSLIVQGADGTCHFHADLHNARQLDQRLERLQARAELTELVEADWTAVHKLYEETFRHQRYTGRSGTMFGYEGLGCVYWHMVSKLMCAVQENFFWALDRQAPAATVETLGDLYYLVRGGLGPDKTPAEYGAFPTDPYSHTPAHTGAQQPGMTGQVKEGILARWGELGVRIQEGQLVFQPHLLRRREFLGQPCNWRYFDLTGRARDLELEVGELAFTVCQVPVVYRLRQGPARLTAIWSDGREADSPALALDAAVTRQLFARTGELARLRLDIPESLISRA